MLNVVLNIMSLGLFVKLRLSDKPGDGESYFQGYYNAWSLKSQVQCTAVLQISWITLEDGFVSL